MRIRAYIGRDPFKRMVLGDGILPIPNEYLLVIQLKHRTIRKEFWFPKNTWSDSDRKLIAKHGWKFSPWVRYPKKPRL